MSASYLLTAASQPDLAPAWAILALPSDVGHGAALSAHADGYIRLWMPLPSGSAALLSSIPHAAARGASQAAQGNGIGVGFLTGHAMRDDANAWGVLSSAMDGSISYWRLNLGNMTRAGREAAQRDQEGQSSQASSATTDGLATELLAPIAGVGFLRSPFPSGEKAVEAYSTAICPSGNSFAVAGEAGIGVYHLDAASSAILPDTDGTSEPNTFARPMSRITLPEKPRNHTKERKNFGTCLAYNSTGSLLACGTDSGQVFVYSSDTSTLLAVISDHALPIRAVSFSASLPGNPTTDHLHVCSEDQSVTLHDVMHLAHHANKVSSMNADEGRRVSTVVANLRHPGWVTSAAQGPLLATSCTDGSVRLWDTGSGGPRRMVAQLREGPRVWACAWASTIEAQQRAGRRALEKDYVPDLTLLLSASEDGTVRWYRPAGTGQGPDGS